MFSVIPLLIIYNLNAIVTEEDSYILEEQEERKPWRS
jgi:hypothetical protein